MISLSLPYPPSANRLWRNFGGRSIKSAEYRSWLLRGQDAITKACVMGSIAGAYHLELQAVRPDRRARDIDNLLKPVGDLLASAGLIENDCKAASVYAAWSGAEPVKGGSITVILREAA